MTGLMLFSGCISDDFSEAQTAPGENDGGSDVSDAGVDAAGPGDAGDLDSGDTTDVVEPECVSSSDCQGQANELGTCDPVTQTCEFTCEEGYDDCDGDDSNGCEAELGSIDHCGGCGDVCSPSEGTNYAPTCQDMVCGTNPGTCAEGFGDLDQDSANGCECEISEANDVPDGVDTNCDGVDGIVAGANANVVFVSPDGADTNTGLSPDSALGSLQEAIDLAHDQTRSYVLAAGGSFKERIALKDGVSIYGGYDPGNGWARDTESRETIIEPKASDFAAQAEHFKSVTAVGLTGTVLLDHVTVLGVDAQTPGGTTYGIWVRASDDVVVRNSKIVAGAGGDGLAGANGHTPMDGSCNAPGGTGGDVNTSTLQCSNPGTADTGAAGADGTQSGSGGAGGNGGAHSCPSTGSTCNAGAGDGGTILNGAGGQSGSNGAPGTPHGAVVGGEWSPSAGSAPSDGGDGGGGGGGGAGGDCFNLGTTSRGGAGGHGGAGGCGATKGNNGMNGGGSFGLFIANSTVEIDAVEVIQSDGGQGGSGGDGGTGQQAPNTGWSSGAEGATSGGGDGGDGGFGGDGGHGGAGAGGCGGPTIGIASDASTVIVNNVNFTTPSQGAQGGDGGAHQDPSTGDAPGGCTGAVAREHEFSPAPTN